jgi:mannose-6-phosphate isomerase-like protein (cupin superfamily)
MFVSRAEDAPVRHRAGLSSRILLQAGDRSDAALAVTWVDVQPGAEQHLHSHDPQQVYVVITGTGRMRVGEATRDVSGGDLVFVPSRALHGIVNTGTGTLTYVSSATPTFNITDFYDTGQPTEPPASDLR